MNIKKLEEHIKLCIKNLNGKAKCCANCPFEEEIVSIYPNIKDLFIIKRKERLNKKLKQASKIVEKWPDWKRSVAGNLRSKK